MLTYSLLLQEVVLLKNDCSSTRKSWYQRKFKQHCSNTSTKPERGTDIPNFPDVYAPLQVNGWGTHNLLPEKTQTTVFEQASPRPCVVIVSAVALQVLLHLADEWYHGNTHALLPALAASCRAFGSCARPVASIFFLCSKRPVTKALVADRKYAFT